MSEHHVEMWTNDYRTWGWQCFTCREETGGYLTLAMAEAGGERHVEEFAESPAVALGEHLRGAS